MKLLHNMLKLSEASDDLTELPPDIVDEIQKNIRDGAKDQQQLWSNALELVQKAYEVAGVQRPTPDMKSAWSSYETLLQYAVEQLAKYRGIDGDWRMSSAIFHEAMEKKIKVRVVELGSNQSKSHVVSVKSIDDIVNAIKRRNTNYDVKIDKSKDPENPNYAVMTFSKWGIRKNYKVKIQQLI